MLRSLVIRDFVIVEHVELELTGGFSVLTGETGAGKSILVDAIELLVGGRGDPVVVREGAESAELAAEFELDARHPLAAWLAERELQGDAGVLLVRRTIERTGRSRCFVNGHAATLAQLREAGEYLVDIHGQHAHQSLLRPAAQRELLDFHCGALELARETAETFRAWRRLETLAAEAQAQYSRREAERAELRDQADELGKLAPREGEWAALAAEHRRLAHGSSLLGGAQSSLETLSEAEGASIAQLAAVCQRLRALQEHDASLAPIVEMLESAHAQANEAVRALRQYASRLDLDPDALRETESRIEAMHAAARKHRIRPEELGQHLQAVRARLAELELAGDPEALQREVGLARQRYDAAARALTARRMAGAESLARAVSEGMQQLAMKGGRLGVALRPLEAPGAAGAEEVEFEVAAHPSLPMRPLAKVASGGELARISLAIQLVASQASAVTTLVFDEVDAGIGGAVAETVGRSLRRLGRARQVLCVTHLPQVAAQGDAQWSVAKASARGKVSVSVAALKRSERIEELARMLGGAEITATTRKHAAEMLAAGAET